MPLALDPESRFRLVLKQDESRYDDDKAPAFWFRYMNGREWIRFAEIADGVEGSKSGSEALIKMFDALRIPLVGWDNIVGRDGNVIDYDPVELDMVLGVQDVSELLSRVMSHVSPGGEDLKKSESL